MSVANKSIVYVLDFPEPEIDPQACVRALAFAPKPDCVINVGKARDLRQQQEDLIKKVSADYKNVRVIDPFDILCGDVVCPITSGEKSLYIDRDHLSRDGSRMIASFLARAID